ncbi:uncharacterized PE-PGRS family protein PE_PGRS54-like [Pollicipes pollicipes]|uniref:uncharacterized PE-PGRS family protein PE_PGRS54-like n=1 Tax=Pollicipes pollicipes TaxID=41117 RepID=UPI00188573C4|nr:uncharacterized PE-PGRS family protein PE_PGRS54-like [Pollicipes pollicipes]
MTGGEGDAGDMVGSRDGEGLTGGGDGGDMGDGQNGLSVNGADAEGDGRPPMLGGGTGPGDAQEALGDEESAGDQMLPNDASESTAGVADADSDATDGGDASSTAGGGASRRKRRRRLRCRQQVGEDGSVCCLRRRRRRRKRPRADAESTDPAGAADSATASADMEAPPVLALS